MYLCLIISISKSIIYFFKVSVLYIYLLLPAEIW